MSAWRKRDDNKFFHLVFSSLEPRRGGQRAFLEKDRVEKILLIAGAGIGEDRDDCVPLAPIRSTRRVHSSSPKAAGLLEAKIVSTHGHKPIPHSPCDEVCPDTSAILAY
jgi:hypothetical protein